VPRRAFNQILIESQGVVGKADLRNAVEHFDSGGVRYRARIRDVAEERLGPRLAREGLVRVGGLPAMVFDGSLPEERPTSLRIEGVTDDSQFADFVGVVAKAFEWEAEQLARVFTPRLLNEEGWYGWTGYENGKPVAASQLVVHSATGGLYYVAVDNAHRRKGYGEAITRIAIEAAWAAGCDLATLSASQFGYPVYKRMGFRDAGQHIGYIPRNPESTA
jgi:ribosomal protein S18 acetylase RimI-like enzyme